MAQKKCRPVRASFAQAQMLANEMRRALDTGDLPEAEGHAKSLRKLLPRLSLGKSPEEVLKLLCLRHVMHFVFSACGWSNKMYQVGIAEGSQAIICEDQLWQRNEVFSDAAWALVSSLADGGERERAHQLTRVIMGNATRLAAMVASARLRTELLFTAMLGNFSDDADHDQSAYAALHDHIHALIPQPRTGNLFCAFAAYHAEHGDPDRAIECLGHTFTALPQLREALRTERCFNRIASDPRFLRLIAGDTHDKRETNNVPKVSPDPFADQFESTVNSVLAHARLEGVSCTGIFFAELLIEVNGGVLPFPAELRQIAKHAAQDRSLRGEVAYWQDSRLKDLQSFTTRLWTALAEAGALFEVRGRALARRIVFMSQTGVVPLRLLAQATEKQWSDASQMLTDTLAKHAPNVPDPCAMIDERYLSQSPATEGQDGFQVTFYPSGHLQRAWVRKDGKDCNQELILDARPGSGRFTMQGERDGYGFITREEFSDGAIRGTLNTPWHDGDDYFEPKYWQLWVDECLNSLAGAAAE